ncbi:MAG: serine hydrolase [Pirellulales bacterium]
MLTKRVEIVKRLVLAAVGGLAIVGGGLGGVLQAEPSRTRVGIQGDKWTVNDLPTESGTPAAGLLMNVRMVNATFEDALRNDFDSDANTTEFLAALDNYSRHGIRAITLSLQGGYPGYEGAHNSAFQADGSLRPDYLARIHRVITACDRAGIVVILGCYYQRQDQLLQDEDAVRRGVTNVARWIRDSGYQNVVLEIANEFQHGGFDHPLLRSTDGQVELIKLARKTHPQLLVSTSGMGDGTIPRPVAEAADYLLIHFNTTPLTEIPARIAQLRPLGKPIVCNEDDKTGRDAAAAARLCVQSQASWGLMAEQVNQRYPFEFHGADDDPVVYDALRRATMPHRTDYFPPPESQGGWRKLSDSHEIRQTTGADPTQLASLRDWLLQSDDRDFAAVVIHRGYIVLEVERNRSSVSDSQRVASVSKAICATVLAIASEQSQHDKALKKMSFDDRAFDFLPWAQPLSDPRKSQITVRQLLNHTSGICPESTGAPNDGSWEYILGLTGDERTSKLAFDPGAGCGYSTHALSHAALVCENVVGKPYDEFAIEALFRPIGCEHWWFQYYDGGPNIGRHPSHGMGMSARDLARIAYCLLRDGRWGHEQIVPQWFVDETAGPTHHVQSRELRWSLNPAIFSHGWELPARLDGQDQDAIRGDGIPDDARYKPGSGGQLIAFVPSLDLVVTRQTGSSGSWQFAEYLRRACAAVSP